MISKKAKYALRALLAIAAEPEGDTLNALEISRRHDIPHKFLEQILVDLRKNGILESRRGKGGGYSMLRPADTVTLAEILRIFDGPLAPLPCLSRTAYRACEECESEGDCRIRALLAPAYEASRRRLEDTTLEEARYRRADDRATG